jgi:hypothetical protein
MPSGGPGRGQGRKSRAEEEKTSTMARNAIAGKYGTPEAGFIFLLETKEPSLIKFVFEHAFGKPQDNVSMDVTGNVKFTGIEIVKPDEVSADTESKTV